MTSGGLTGAAIVRKMREQCKEKRPLFIAITGYGREEDRRLSAQAGIDLHLLKPVDPERLQNLMKRFANIVLPPV
jgi:two-component system OmpR family response regulator